MWLGDSRCCRRRRKSGAAEKEKPETHVYFPTLAFKLPRSAGLDGVLLGYARCDRRGLRTFRNYGVTVVRVEENDLEVRNYPKAWDAFHTGCRYWIFPAHVEAPAINNGSFLRFFDHCFRPCRDLADSKAAELTHKCRPFERFVRLARLEECSLQCERVDMISVEYPPTAPPARIGAPFLEWILTEPVVRILDFANANPTELREPLYKRRLRDRRSQDTNYDPLCDALCWRFQRTLRQLHASALNELADSPPVTDLRTRALNCRYEFGFSITAICRNPVPALVDRLRGFLGSVPRYHQEAADLASELLHRKLLEKHRSYGSAGGVYEIPAAGTSELLPGDLALIIPPSDAGQTLPTRYLQGVRNLQNVEFLSKLQPVQPILMRPRDVRESVPSWRATDAGPRAATAEKAPRARGPLDWQFDDDDRAEALEDAPDAAAQLEAPQPEAEPKITQSAPRAAGRSRGARGRRSGGDWAWAREDAPDAAQSSSERN